MEQITITLPNNETKVNAFSNIADARGFLDGDKYKEEIITIPAGQEIPNGAEVISEKYSDPIETISGYEYNIESIDEDGNITIMTEVFDKEQPEDVGELINIIKDIPAPELISTEIIIKTPYNKIEYGIHMFGQELIEWYTRIKKDSALARKMAEDAELKDISDNETLDTDGSSIE